MTRKTKKNVSDGRRSGDRSTEPAVKRTPAVGIVIGEVRLTRVTTHWKLGDVGRIGKIAGSAQ